MATILRIIKATDIPPVLEVQASDQKSKQSATKNQSKKSEKVETLSAVNHLPTSDVDPPIVPEKVKKILPPIPSRTPEELRISISNYREKLKAATPHRIPAMEGTVSTNITEEGCQNLYPRQFDWLSINITQVLLFDSAIVIPTWEVLTDNTLSIRAKARQLHAIGWEPKIIPVKGFREICLLAQILKNGVH
jgi:hypothetical protein